MLHTKSIQDKKEIHDGIRISIMRKPHGDYDLLILALAPSELLLQSYHDKKITWDEYEKAFLLEMKNSLDAQRMLQFISKILNFTDVTLLCWEQMPDQCHRRLIAELIAADSLVRTTS
jgi:uncharacterized protein YeaO (DUF488 family)